MAVPRDRWVLGLSVCCWVSALTACGEHVAQTGVERPAPAGAPSLSAKTPEGETISLPLSLEDEILAKAPSLHAVDLDGDGTREVIVEWTERYESPAHRYRVLAAEADGTYAVRSTFGIGDTLYGGLWFLREPDPREPPKAVVTVQGGSYWSEHHLIRPDGTGADEFASGMDHETVDLDGDGLLEWVLTQKHNPLHELRYEGHARSLEVCRWDRAAQRYVRVWPPDRPDRLELGTLLFDVDGDGAQEILSLMDEALRSPETRRLCLFELTSSEAALVAEVPAAHPLPPWDLLPPERIEGGIRMAADLEGESQDDSYELRLDGPALLYVGRR